MKSQAALGFIAVAFACALPLAGCADEDRPTGKVAKVSPDASVDPGTDASVVTPDASPEVLTVDASLDREGGGVADNNVSPPDSGMGAPDVTEVSRPPPDMSCRTARSAEPIPARSVAMSKDAVGGDITIFVGTDLFSRVYNACGSCHVDAGLGGLKLSQLDFKPLSTKAGKNLLDRMLENNPALVMPPVSAGGSINSERKAGDPVIQLITMYRQWMDAGQPADLFRIPRDVPPGGAMSPYVLPPEQGLAMSNIGDCVPGAGLVGTDSAATKAKELDAMFAGLTKAAPGSNTTVPQRIGLPEHLEDTDLFTLDTATLARHRVMAYAPAYPLWSDNARKLRHIRVPVGTSIRFDKATQTFDIPANTRFYKTFLKPVVEKGGSLRYRKIETRLIVARPDRDVAGAPPVQPALFGTYKWDDAEQTATLVTETLNNLEPFKDQLVTLITDEDLAEAVRARTPPTANLAKALQDAHATRKYAIPGSDRCVQCHMGSATKNFILGFFPVQVHRRPAGEGGAIEPAGPDELTQMQRFIDAGIVTGMATPADVAPLEASQGNRKPRNDHELVAQGYLLGNCSHCHNPRGFPSVENVVLRDILNFLPSSAPAEDLPAGCSQVPVPDGNNAESCCSKQGGIFGFSLRCMSPRILRGVGADVRMPYITPSLMDYPTGDGVDYYSPKGFSEAPHGATTKAASPSYLVLAPWRSLIYRNVDTPFTYSDAGAIFPHMPVNTPGFDCRAPRILGDWMISIAAERVNKSIQEDLIAWPGNDGADLSEQPYREVLPDGTPGGGSKYVKALDDADLRLHHYHNGRSYTSAGTYRYSRYTFCPDVSDIQDPAVTLQDAFHLAPPDQDAFGADGSLIMPTMRTPRRAHWVVTDLTQAKVVGWNPRRDDWEKMLVHHCLCNETKPECKNAENKINKDYQCLSSDTGTPKKLINKRVIEILSPPDPNAPGVRWTDELKQYARTPVPFGTWEERKDCSYASQRTVGSYTGAERAKWMDDSNGAARVYNLSPGGAVFGMICINCHGAEADSKGRMADTVLTMTGGSTRVANLRDGLFGMAGSHRSAVFGKAATATVTSEDWAARYLAWMALGGTTKLLPPAVLGVVANTEVLGQKRRGTPAVADANMLETAKNLCKYMLPSVPGIARFDPATGSLDYRTAKTPLILVNGDLELWERLCNIGQPAPVRALLYSSTSKQLGPSPATGLLRPNSYPADAPVGTHRGQIETGIKVDNRFPWCWVASAQEYDAAKAFAHQNAIGGQDLPECPPGYRLGDSATNMLSDDEKEAWAERGAINAGLSVFAYLDDLIQGKIQRTPARTDCPR